MDTAILQARRVDQGLSFGGSFARIRSLLTELYRDLCGGHGMDGVFWMHNCWLGPYTQECIRISELKILRQGYKPPSTCLYYCQPSLGIEY